MGSSATTSFTVPRPKIQVPRPPTNSLPRGRLHRLLSAAHDRASAGSANGGRIVVDVCAPAGYGKTTLLATHAMRLRDRGVPVAWVTCDRHDNDPAQLWSAVLHSISVELQWITGATGTAETFAAMTPPQHEMEPAFLAEFVEAVDALADPIAVVLDDVHELASPATLSGLDALLRNLPDELLLFLGCRFDPPLALPRLRLDGWLHDVRASDLAFTTDEARALLEAQQVSLPDDSVMLLVERTEGWPAALRLAALSLIDEPEPAAFVKDFAGDQRGVADYLVAEVLSRQPDDLREFLVSTCVAEELPVDLAVALSGRADAGAILDRLERANALVIRLGTGRAWYRYHALLRSFLLAELHSRDSDAARRLHAIASYWFAAAEMADPALEHAVAADDDVGVVALLRRFALGQLLSGTGATVRDVLATASRTVAATSEAALIGGIDALERGDLPGAERLLRSVHVPARSDDAWLARLHDAAQLYMARMRGDVTVLSDPLGDRDPEDVTPVIDAHGRTGGRDVQLLVLANQGALRIAAGDYAEARSDLTEALDIALRSRRDYLALYCMNQMSGVAGALSDLPGTRVEAERAITFAAERGWGSSPRMAYAYTLAAWAAYQTLDLPTAARWASTAVGVIHGAITPEVEGAARFAEAVIAFDRPQDRRDALQRFRRVWTTLGAVTPPSPALAAYAGMAELHMCLMLSEHAWARTAVDRIERMLGLDGDAAAMRALLLLRRNRTAQARQVLTPLFHDGPRSAVTTNDITGWLVEAVAADSSDEPHRAHEALTSALTLAAPISALRPFYDMGAPVHDLLVNATGRLGELDTFVARLLRAWANAQAWRDHRAGGTRSFDNGAHPAAGHAPLQPLTVRELEILRNLPSMLTAEEIAEAQVVSINTVKTHLKSIYRKLDVNSRREAVDVSRRAGLL